MVPDDREPFWRDLDHLFKSHPWHGVSTGKDAPGIVTTYVEIVPTDTVKYEMDKVHVYGRDEAHEVLRRSREDYRSLYADFEAALAHRQRT